MKPIDFLEAARVPVDLKPCLFGNGLWKIERHDVGSIEAIAANGDQRARFNLVWMREVGWEHITLLRRLTMANLHLGTHVEVVMDDGMQELRKHLPFMMAARGNVLITGLGLGCVLRGVLANPDVRMVDVVEIDRHILKVVGREFQDNPRVRLHWHDALTWPVEGRHWDAAWHDIWCDPSDDVTLNQLHMQLLLRYDPHVGHQGAWALPRVAHRLSPVPFIGGPRWRRAGRER